MHDAYRQTMLRHRKKVPVDNAGIYFYNTFVMNGGHSPFYYLSKYRAELMGLAIVWILWFHAGFSFGFISAPFLRKTLFFIQESGACGVDVFLMLSGMGVLCSLEKNPVPRFYLNRLKRVGIVWWLFLAIDLILGLLSLETPLRFVEILGRATFTGYWFGLSGQGNWYVYAIMLFYLISPLVYYLLRRTQFARWTYAVLLLAAFGVSVLFFHDEKLMAVSRLPVFLLGMLFAGRREKQKMGKKGFAVCLGFFAAGVAGLYLLTGRAKDLLWDYGLWWYPFFVIAPALSLLIAGLFERTGKALAWLRRGLRTLGNASLEILLTSDVLLFHCQGLRKGMFASEELSVLVLAAVSVIAGILIHKGISACAFMKASDFRQHKHTKPS